MTRRASAADGSTEESVRTPLLTSAARPLGVALCALELLELFVGRPVDVELETAFDSDRFRLAARHPASQLLDLGAVLAVQDRRPEVLPRCLVEVLALDR